MDTLLPERTDKVEGYHLYGSPVNYQALESVFDVEDIGLCVINEFDLIANTAWGKEPIQKLPDVKATSKANNEGLARLLKKGTARSHRAAENVHFVRDFMQHKVSAESYRELLSALFHVYSTLEVELDRCSNLDSRVKAIHFPVLARRATLIEDMQYFYGDNHAALATALSTPSPAAKQYVDRLREIATSQPLLLVAHSYTRYLGDLSGGQLLAKAASKAFNLSTDDGVRFFHFKEVPDAKKFKHQYRAILDGLPISQKEADCLVDEANLAFLHNMRLFQERDVAAGYISAVQSIEDAKAMVNEGKSALSFQKRYAELGREPTASAQCPFLPQKMGSAHQKLQPELADCPLKRFAWIVQPMKRFVQLVQPEQLGVKSVLLGSVLMGSVIHRSFALTAQR